MTKTHDPATWYGDHANLVGLTAWLADNGYDAKAVAHAVEKPWHYEVEYLAYELDMDDADLGLLRGELDDDEDDLTEELRSRKRSRELDEVTKA
jgi:hypothetical protein